MKEKIKIVLQSKTSIAILLILIGLCTYIPSLSGTLFWDDEDFITNNQYVKQQQITKLFTTQAVEGSGKPSNYYRPIQFSMYSFIYALEKDNPLPYHLLSIVFHIFASFAVYLMISTCIKKYSPQSTSRENVANYMGIIISLIFLIHPIQTEAVSYVSGFSDPLVATFGFLSVWLYIQTENTKLPAVSIILFCLALLSKESGIIFGGIIGLVWLYNSRHVLFSLSKKTYQTFFSIFSLSLLPYIVLTATYLLYHWSVIRTLNMSTVWGNHPYTNSLILRIITFLSLLPTYIFTALFPLTLFYDRDFSVQLPTSIWNFPSFFVLCFLLMLFISLLRLAAHYKKWRISLFFFISFFISFLPFTGIVLINGIMYEHYLYTPLVFLFSFIIYSLYLLIPHIVVKKHYRILLLITFMVATLLVIKSWMRQYEWDNPIKFYLQTLQHVPNSFRVRNNLAMEYQQSGEITKAIEEYNKVIDLNPSIPNPYHNLGNLYYKEKQYKEAEQYFLKAIQVDPSFGYSYAALIKLYTETGEQEKLQNITRLIEQRFSN